ncbi:acyl-CoA dehydrogenase family protein [Sutcliffiella sp. NC1]|uniref:acyl-CoA dehydrogenase family protein n=1 Tax=Sutcliffiella sp. NC1 TaxID=3004096 RepID=UPI0022DE29A7|nr:acyl-CoA dehydrogenase family protein [Sutcliffiella sp. NC1]WBL15907.1 acyl-CoA/acyl-ACP dehydrogenase [Sutcliffiella sp. NC1]
MNGITNFSTTKSQSELVEKASQLAQIFSERAAFHDEQAAFPFDNFADIKKAQLLDLTIPKEYGGKGGGLYDFLLLQETIAQGDGPTALCLGWHLGILMNVATYRPWPKQTFEHICKEVVEHQKLLNSAHSEKETGSPARGGKPTTTAKNVDGNWIINGRKSFASLAPILDYFIISATIEETGDVGEFILPRDVKGLSIEETWETMSMRATRSDDLLLDNVIVTEDALIQTKVVRQNKPQGWLLHIPACYLGIAIAARNEAVKFAKEYQPNSLPHPIKEVPKVRERIGKMDVKLMTARHFLYSVARNWDEHPTKREELIEELAAVKYTVTNSAIEIVDEAMRIVGAQSLQLSSPLQRYYRDVRAGLHNPPSDDITLSLLAKKALEE